MTEDTATALSSDELVTPGSMYKGNGPMKCEPNQLEPPRESFQLSVFRLRKMPLLLEEEPDNPHITLLRSLGLLALQTSSLEAFAATVLSLNGIFIKTVIDHVSASHRFRNPALKIKYG